MSSPRATASCLKIEGWFFGGMPPGSLPFGPLFIRSSLNSASRGFYDRGLAAYPTPVTPRNRRPSPDYSQLIISSRTDGDRRTNSLAPQMWGNGVYFPPWYPSNFLIC